MSETQEHGRQRPAPTFTRFENTARNKDMQHGAAQMQVHADAQKAGSDTSLLDSDFTLSVDDIRRLLFAADIEKSKDTIQRYCRTGDLECRKLGMLKRFYVTEKSTLKLIEKLQLDAPVSTFTQVHADADTRGGFVAEIDADKNSPQPKDISDERDAPASTFTQVHATAPTYMQPDNDPDNARGRVGEVECLLRDQLKQAHEEIEFLREEVRDARQHKGATREIASRMLETLETIAVGGKLMPPKEPQQPAEPVHVDVPEPGARHGD